MKFTTIITAAALAISTPAFADTPTFVGTAEYAVEAETFEASVGAEVVLDQYLTVTPTVYGMYTSGGDFKFSGADIKGEFAVDGNVSLYTTVEFDNGFNYDDVVVGVEVRF